ncbi:AAA domain-containing protein [Mycoplasma miroungirhinis]|uniref:RAP domain-containing protein n=1 Tax=Mycoplasma miroungirhinis TaxID=754516 RepID=A0A6M4JDD3_9MOLU|nr:AAA domain-containing protein [Mycoplasma miroungirhinis]QJR44079.1 hypothetical protein HLA92_01350 [Mycoplasma miroungirhinis]
MSLYKLIGIYFSIPVQNELIFSLPNLSLFNAEVLSDLKIIINEIEDYCKYFSFKVQENPWWGSKWININQSQKEDIILKLKSLTSLAYDVYDNILNVHTSITFNDQKFALNVKYLKEIFQKILVQKIKINSEIFKINDFDKEIKDYQYTIDKFKTKIELEDKIKNVFNLEILKEDLKKFKEFYLESVDKKIKIFNSKWSFVKSIIKKYSLIKNKTEIQQNIYLLFNYYDIKSELDYVLNNMEYKLKNIDLDILNNTKQSIDLAYTIVKFNTIANFVIDINKLIPIINLDIRYPNEIQETLTKINLFLSNFEYISSNFDENIINFEILSIPQLNLKINNLITYEKDLNNMTRINNSIFKSYNLGLKNFIDVLFSSNMKKSFYDVFLKRFYKMLIDNIIQTYLPEFNDSNLETFRNIFNSIEIEIKKLAKAKIESNLLKNIPSTVGLNSQNIEIKILKSEANKSRNIMPFKKLFEKIPNLLLNLKPCLMMSPLSVSAYLKDSDIIFDTVIFDEASQVRPETAIGAISRAKQIIIVGDTEQLPPTNFFNTIDQEFNDEDVSDDISIKGFDSILSMANIALKTIKLKWHYRSLFEELIYPSNQEIYNNLITFPSKIKPQAFEGINKIYVEGYFIDRRNEIEASKVVETIKTIIDTYGLNSSVGVVTFNQEQEMLIEKKIDKFKQKYPQYSSFFDRNKQDPFFIKNIETVQGDEKEFIIISTVYGPYSTGKIHMRFGPINQENGYKRLNVAFTRAKRGTILVSSLKYEDIDLNRSESRGIKFLKDYFWIAEFGINKLIDKKNNNYQFDSYFEKEVYQELAKIGYKVHTQVGSSGYRIDLAIEDPKNPNSFLLGIECDGASYHSSKTARDRDRLRQEVLEKRGWKIHRIWSTDWFNNKQNQINKLQNVIKDIKTANVKKSSDNNNNLFNSEQQLFKIVKKQEIKIDFLENYEFNEDFLKKHFLHMNSSFNDVYLVIKKVIIELKVVHLDDISKLLNDALHIRSSSTYFKKYFNLILKNLINEDFKLDDKFLISNQIHENDIQFKFGLKRPLDKIHYFEFVNLIVQIVKSVKLINLESLMKTLKSYLLYTSFSSKAKDTLLKIIQKLVDDKFIEYNQQTQIFYIN